ncbi:MAG: hypothetical protein Q8R34_01220 [bacterium]|nr:hypothetical protein [bacterium]
MRVVEITLEMREAAMKTLYHHPRSSPFIVQMITGRVFEAPPPKPTEKEKQIANETVEALLKYYYENLRQAVLEVTGEDIEEQEVG